MRLTRLLRSSEDVRRADEGGNEDPEIESIAFDSRRVEPGTLFVALVGATHDGHDYLAAAVEGGAVALMVDRGWGDRARELGVPVLVADDTRRRLGPIASRFYGDPSRDLPVVGVTGTNGKTTVSFLIEAALRHAEKSVGVLGTVSYRWPGHVEPAPNTTPESLVTQRLLAQMRDDGVEAVAMEVSSHGLATHRLEGTAFDAAVFTNLSQDHLDFHGSMESYRAAKAALFEKYLVESAAAGKAPVAILNVDDAEGRRLAELAPRLAHEGVTTTTYSAQGAPADWSCRSWNQEIEGTELTMETPDGSLDLTTRLLGAFNVANVLATLAACSALGVGPEVVARGLRDLSGVPGRLQHLGGGAEPDVFVDYAHTPDALARALDALRPLVRGRLVVVFGCGGDRDRDKRPKMGAAAAEGADFVVLTSDNPRTEDAAAIIDDIRPAMRGAATADLSERTGWAAVVDRREAIATAIAKSVAGDVILVAGKGHETYQEVAGRRHAFDDVAMVKQALG